jgi:hypothetical protein
MISQAAELVEKRIQQLCGADVHSKRLVHAAQSLHTTLERRAQSFHSNVGHNLLSFAVLLACIKYLLISSGI